MSARLQVCPCWPQLQVRWAPRRIGGHVTVEVIRAARPRSSNLIFYSTIMVVITKHYFLQPSGSQCWSSWPTSLHVLGVFQLLSRSLSSAEPCQSLIHLDMVFQSRQTTKTWRLVSHEDQN